MIVKENYLFLYCVLEAFITNNGTSIPSPVNLEQWKTGFQLNGCIRRSRVYTQTADNEGAMGWEGLNMAGSFRIPPEGMESSSHIS